MRIFILILSNGQIVQKKVLSYDEFDQIFDLEHEAREMYGSQPGYCFDILIT